MDKFKVIIAGGRNFSDYQNFKSFIEDRVMYVGDIEIISGACHVGVHTFTRKDGTKVYGADGCGERFADEKNLDVTLFPADWQKHGKSAGVIRNKLMAEFGDCLITAWDNKSKGTKNMIDESIKLGLPVYIFRYET